MFASYLLDLIQNTRATDRAKVSIAQSVGTGIRENATRLSKKLHRVDGKSPMANAERTRSASEIAVGTDPFQPADRVTDFDRVSQPRFAEVSATVRITAFKPGQSPLGATTPIRLLLWSFYCLCGQPGVAILANERDAFVHRVYAMRDFKIDLAGEFVAFLEHRAVSPFNEFGPHFSYENQGRVIKLADLEELPCE